MSDHKRILYVFLDEGGNLDFSSSGTRYFVLTGLSKERPFEAYKSLCELKYDLIELDTEIEYFHAAEDRQVVRNSVFEIINRHLDETHVDSLIIEKGKPALSLHNVEDFYPQVLGLLLKRVVQSYDLQFFAKAIVFTDNLPVQRKRKAIEKAIKQTLSGILPAHVRYQIFHHASKSNMDLQIVDYCNWAIYRKWETGDRRSYEIISRAVRNEMEWGGG